MDEVSDDLTDPLWGTGYGDKRHLVDMETLVWPNGQQGRRALARCVDHRNAIPTRLEFIAGDVWRPYPYRRDATSIVESRKPCARCQKIADREDQRRPYEAPRVTGVGRLEVFTA